MMKLLVLLVALVSVASAYQRAFYGGDFTQAEGIYSPGFAVYDDNSKGWRRVPPLGLDPLDTNARVYDHYPVGEHGIFAVGEFKSINNGVPSFSIAFFDGTKWCAVRQGLANSRETNNIDGNGVGRAVWCDSDTSCWVAGQFSHIENAPENAPNNPENFAHYIRESATSGEWLFDSSVTEWNEQDAPAGLAPQDAIPGTLVGVPATNPEYFFVASGDSDSYGTSSGFSSIHRGGKGDGGWNEFLSTSGVFPSATALRGFDIDAESSSPGVYVVSNSGTSSEFAKKTSVLLRPCPPGSSCSGGSVTSDAEWNSLIPSGTNFIDSLYDVAVVNATTRYYVGDYNPGGNFNTRNIVLVQDGFTSPVPVGSPFAKDAINIYRVAVYEGKPVAVGNFETANLVFPANTEDNSGVAEADIRELDTVHYVAIYENGAWNAHFGGGLNPTTLSADDLVRALIVRHNPQSNTWSFTSPEITYVHNIKAEGLAYFDDAEDLNSKNIYALFTRRLVRRDGTSSTPAEVYDVACETDECKWVYAGGNFGYHGTDLLGAIAKVEVRREEPEILAVGGGLWFTDDGVVPADQNLQFTPGSVYAVKALGDWVYAGGRFNRGKNGYVCLNGLARIRHSDVESGSWEPLAGGCDNDVYDLHFWGNDLYVAGSFENCGGTLVNYVTAYNNGAYQSLNNGLDGTAYSLEYFQERMIVGGEFGHAGGLPVHGVASWDGNKWRALEAACTQDCTPGDLASYFTVPTVITGAIDLRASKDGTVLYARATTAASSSSLVLAQWKYFDQSESGQWTIKGDHLAFDTSSLVPYGDAIINNGTQLVVAGITTGTAFAHSGYSVHAYSLVQENWVDNEILVGQHVYVVRSSASTLSSFLSFLF